MIKRYLSLLVLPLALAACVDTTGLSAESSREPKGNPNGAIVVQEFADLQCPSCKAAQESIVKPLLEERGMLVRFEFRHFPLRSIHRYAIEAAEAAECAADQGKFWEFVDLAYVNQANLSPKAIQEWASTLQLDMDLFERCTDSHIKRDGIMAEYDIGKEQLGVSGTPTFFVNGQRVESTLGAINAAIDAAMSGVGAPRL
jgi:protein-disulfide isomerase